MNTGIFLIKALNVIRAFKNEDSISLTSYPGQFVELVIHTVDACVLEGNCCSVGDGDLDVCAESARETLAVSRCVVLRECRQVDTANFFINASSLLKAPRT